MSEHSDIKSNFSSLEDRVQKLIHLHEALKSVNKKLVEEKTQIAFELNEEKEKSRRLEEGYKNLKEMEKSSARQSINNMKRKISDIIVEIDRNVSMIENKS